MRRVLAVLLLVAGCRSAAAATDEATVEHVVDGDTIDVRIGDRRERIRLLGIDTPEVYVDTGPPDCYGPEASAFTKGLLPTGTPVRLERDIVGRDDYGRLLAYVYLVGDGTLVNEAIVRQGYARPLTIAPNGVFADRLVAAAVAAEAEDLGLWGACGG
jgi:micrococcal nuclease